MYKNKQLKSGFGHLSSCVRHLHSIQCGLKDTYMKQYDTVNKTTDSFFQDNGGLSNNKDVKRETSVMYFDDHFTITYRYNSHH